MLANLVYNLILWALAKAANERQLLMSYAEHAYLWGLSYTGIITVLAAAAVYMFTVAPIDSHYVGTSNHQSQKQTFGLKLFFDAGFCNSHSVFFFIRVCLWLCVFAKPLLL